MENDENPKTEPVAESSNAKSFVKKTRTVATIFGMLVAALIATFVGQYTKGYFQKNAAFKEFLSPDKSFSALLPQGPRESSKKINTPIGSIRTFAYNAKSKHHEFSIAYCDYPDSFVAATDPKQILAGAADGAVHNIQGKLLGETSIDMNGIPGTELKIETPQKMVLKSRIYFAGKRLFQIMAIGKPDHAFDKELTEVFDSFKIKG
jgi:hypothetical protein